MIGDRDVGRAGEHGGDLGSRAHRHDRRVGAELHAVALEEPLGDAEIGVGLRRGGDPLALEAFRVGEGLDRLRDREVVGPLNDGPDDHPGAAVLARDHHHRGVSDGEICRAPQHGREGLRVAAGGAHLHGEAVLLEDAGVHPDVEVDVAQVVDGLAEADGLEARGARDRGRQRGADRQAGDAFQDRAPMEQGRPR